MLAKSRKLVTHLHHSASATTAFLRKQVSMLGIEPHRALTIPQDVQTRWNSTFMMIERILKLQNVIQAFMVSQDSIDAEDYLKDLDFEIMGRVKTILQPFYDLTKQFSSNKATVACVIPNLIGLRQFLEKVPSQKVGTFKGLLLTAVEDRFFNPGRGQLNILRNKLYTIPTMLDPRLRKVIQSPSEDFDIAKQHLIAAVVDEMATMSPTPEPDASLLVPDSGEPTFFSCSCFLYCL